MTLKGKVIVDAKYEKVEIRDNGIAVVTGIMGKTQTIKLFTSVPLKRDDY